MENKDWLDALEAGSEVLITSTWVKPRIAQVDRTTKTMIVVGSFRFHRSTGRQVGAERFGSHHLQRVTDGFREIHIREALKEKILGKLDKASTEELDQINVILTKERP